MTPVSSIDTWLLLSKASGEFCRGDLERPGVLSKPSVLSVRLGGHVGPNNGKGSLELSERQNKRTRNAIQGLVSGFAACLSLTAPAAAVLTENAVATSIKMPMDQLSGNPGVSSRYVMHYCYWYRVRALQPDHTQAGRDQNSQCCQQALDVAPAFGIFGRVLSRQFGASGRSAQTKCAGLYLGSQDHGASCLHLFNKQQMVQRVQGSLACCDLGCSTRHCWNAGEVC